MSAGIAAAQDFSKTYALPAGGKVVIKNISGDIKVSGYVGNTIAVEAKRIGRDRDLVKVEDLSSGDNTLRTATATPA